MIIDPRTVFPTPAEARSSAPADAKAPPLLTEDEAAAYLRVSEHTLRKWRNLATGPAFARIGNCIRYRLIDLDDFVEQRVQRPSQRAIHPPAISQPNRAPVAGAHHFEEANNA